MPRGEAIQNVDAPFNSLVGSGVANAKVRVLVTENVAGDNQQIIADGFGDKGASRSPRRFGEHVEGAAGIR